MFDEIIWRNCGLFVFDALENYIVLYSTFCVTGQFYLFLLFIGLFVAALASWIIVFVENNYEFFSMTESILVLVVIIC